MLRKLITIAVLGGLAYGVYMFADNSNFFGTRGVDRSDRMDLLEDAASNR